MGSSLGPGGRQSSRGRLEHAASIAAAVLFSILLICMLPALALPAGYLLLGTHLRQSLPSRRTLTVCMPTTRYMQPAVQKSFSLAHLHGDCTVRFC